MLDIDFRYGLEREQSVDRELRGILRSSGGVCRGGGCKRLFTL
jgi:hypothetical protein